MRKLKMEELNRIDVAEFKNAEKIPIVIVLDNIRSMHNVGSTFRTADAFRVQKIILTGITAQPPHRDIHKVALGATESMDWQYFQNIDDAINDLEQKDFQIVAIEQTDKSILLQNFEPKKGEKYALVFGNEMFGVTDSVIEKMNLCIEIPQFGTKHSLNISVTVGIVVWDFAKKIGFNF